MEDTAIMAKILKRSHSSNTIGTHQDEGKNLKYLPPGIIQENGKKDVGFLLEETINETISIANAARAGNQLASLVNLVSGLDECSKAFEWSQASVGALCTQMARLDTLALKAKDVAESGKERGREPGQVRREEENNALAVTVLKLMEGKLRLGGEIQSLKAQATRLEPMGQKKADNNPY